MYKIQDIAISIKDISKEDYLKVLEVLRQQGQLIFGATNNYANRIDYKYLSTFAGVWSRALHNSTKRPVMYPEEFIATYGQVWEF